MGRLMVLLLALAGALQGQPSWATGDRMLVFTRTAGYRHDSIPAAVAAIRALAARHGIGVDHTEDAAVFRPDNLARFKAVGFVNTTAMSSTASSSGPSRLSSQRAAVTSESIRRPTPATTGPGTGSFSARSSRAIRPACRPASCALLARPAAPRRSRGGSR